MKKVSRARRRGDQLRMKSRALAVTRRWFGLRQDMITPRDIGVNASTRCRPCGCWMCQEHGKEVPPRRERAFDYHESD